LGFLPTAFAVSWRQGKAEDDQQKNTGSSELTNQAAVALPLTDAGTRASFQVRLPAYARGARGGFGGAVWGRRRRFQTAASGEASCSPFIRPYLRIFL
jgi:hypothetical protein